MSKRPTIYDVAAAAGVAASTVSRTFSRPGRVNERTAEHVRQVAATLGFHANPVARALSTDRTSLLGLVVADVANPFFSEITQGAQRAADEAGYTVLLVNTQESGAHEKRAIERSLSLVDGVILASSRLSDAAIRMVAKQKPTVVLNRVLPGVQCIVPDIRGGVAAALNHLRQCGHEQLVYVAGPEASWSDGMRWRCTRELGDSLPVRIRRVGPFPPTVAGGGQCANLFPGLGATAALAYNDLIAIGLIRGLAERGMRVPDQLSVAGFDDTLAGRLVTPALTTVSTPLESMGSQSVVRLARLIASDGSDKVELTILPSRLVVRDSTSGAAPPFMEGPRRSPTA
jgi:LacI family transcriptional regulator